MCNFLTPWAIKKRTGLTLKGDPAAAFNFLNLFRQQISGNGQFDTPPAPIKGNVVNLADPEDFTMGFFMVSSVVSKEVEISGEE